MSFKAHYSIFPHGIQYRQSTDTCDAVFKIMVTLEHQDTYNTHDIAKNWKELKKGIDQLNWSYSFDKTSGDLQVNHDGNGDPQLPGAISFVHKYVDGSSVESPSFKFGEGFISKGSPDVYHDAFGPFFKDPTRIDLQWSTPKPITQPLRQMGIENVLIDNGESIVSRDRYGSILSAANEYSKNNEDPKLRFFSEDEESQEEPVDGTHKKEEIPYLAKDNPRFQPDLMPTYASILDEPEAAEIRFGIIREFRIPITDISDHPRDDDNRHDIDYRILLNGTDLEVDCLLIQKDKKYYNGIAQLMLKSNVFAETRFEFIDPYNKFLNQTDQELTHPDGMYMLVEYNDEGGMKDPFENDSQKGFNVVTKVPLTDSYHSLSYHRKKFEFLHENPCNLSFTTSGALSPQGEILTQGSRYRANVLFAWRGDNLIVNRIVKTDPADTGEFDEMETISEHETEGFMVSKELFTVDTELVKGTQVQLYDRRVDFPYGDSLPYEFYLRTVTPAGFCIPLVLENPDVAHCLSFEELVSSGDKFSCSTFPMNDIEYIPIKKLSILEAGKGANPGEPVVEKDPEKVDGPQHLVLREKLEINNGNQLQVIQEAVKETSRFVYPPKIKFEDFRFHHWLSKKPLGTSDPTTFIERCLKLEARSRVPIPEKVASASIEPVKYLSDIRGENVIVTPGDLFTINYLFERSLQYPYHYAYSGQVFMYLHDYPYYKLTTSCELTLERHLDSNAKADNTLSLITREGSPAEIIHEDLSDGLFAFRFYSSNTTGLAGVLGGPHSFLDINTASVRRPPEPLLDKNHHDDANFTAHRIKDLKWQNSWFQNFVIDRTDFDEHGHLWKSIKHLETNKRLRLTEDEQTIKELLQTIIVNDPLLESEYPYELFLKEEVDSQLKTSIYPIELNFSFKVKKELVFDDRDEIVHLILVTARLNDEDTLYIQLDAERRLVLYVNNHTWDEENQLKFDVENDFRILFDKGRSSFILQNENGEELWVFNKPIDPEISINSFEIEPTIFDYFLLMPEINYLRLYRNPEYVFIHDEGQPHYLEKTVTLFGSSIFQAYYPSLEDELSVGMEGAVLDFKIPNNTKPSQPVLQSDILMVQQSSDNGDSKSFSMRNVARILLPKDFMKESQNKLGIILRKVSNASADSGANEVLSSEIGEDISKLTTVDWSNDTLYDTIDFNAQMLELTKYFNKDDKYFYEIDKEVYEVLECKPYYNIELKKWQVLVPLTIKKTETLFVKFSTIKIACGHGKVGDKDSNDENNPYRDETNTNWSEISDATHVPVYGTKEYQIESVSGTNDEFKLIDHSESIYDEKTYGILVKSTEAAVLNVFDRNSSSGTDELADFTAFAFKKDAGEPYSTEKGKVLLTSNLDELYIKVDHEQAETVTILEFENHENAEQIGKEAPEFLKDKNPLFDLKGLRLINMAEFRIG